MGPVPFFYARKNYFCSNMFFFHLNAPFFFFRYVRLPVRKRRKVPVRVSKLGKVPVKVRIAEE